MKICPACRKTYADDNLNFCLDDGAILNVVDDKPPATVAFPVPPPTSPGGGQMSQPTVRTSWDNQEQYSMPPKKSSKAWLWAVGVISILLLLCGGGLVSVLVYVLNQADDNTNNRNGNGRNGIFEPTPTPDDRTSVHRVDLSGWVQRNSQFGITEFTGGELIMSSKSAGFYFVLVAQQPFSTLRSTTRLSVRNIDNADSSMGYGLIFHSDPTPLQRDYAFLIDSRRKRFRVVRHLPQNEINVINWTNSDEIRDGTQENILEARDLGGRVELYINSRLVGSIQNVLGSSGGVPGVYSGDRVRAAFSGLEIRR